MKDKRTLHEVPINAAHGQEEMPPSSRSITQIFQEIVNRVSEIIRSEVRLARAEIREDLGDYARAGRYLVVAGLLACFALGFVLLGVVFALAAVLDAWLAAVLVGVLVGIVGAVTFAVGRKRMKLASLKPDKTLQTLEDNISWFKKQTR